MEGKKEIELVENSPICIPRACTVPPSSIGHTVSWQHCNKEDRDTYCYQKKQQEAKIFVSPKTNMFKYILIAGMKIRAKLKSINTVGGGLI